MTSLQALAERLEKATGPDREIDAALWWAFGKRAACGAYFTGAMGLPKGVDEMPDHFVQLGDGLGRQSVIVMAPRLTKSLDAAIALCARVLPGCWWSVDREFVYDRGELREQFVGRLRKARDTYLHVLTAPTPALALVRAIVRARIAEETPLTGESK